MHIDAFDSTAALARVEHCSVNQRINGRIQVGISTNIAWIFTTQFRGNWEESSCSSLLHLLAASNRTGEVDEVELAIANQLNGGFMIKVNILENIFGNSHLVEGLSKTLTYLQGLCGVLEYHSVARNQPGNQRIDGDQVWIIPGSHDKDHSVRLPLDQPSKAAAVLYDQRFQRGCCDLGHVKGSLFKASELSPVTHRPTHLMGQLNGHLVHRLPYLGHCLETEINPLLQRSSGPI